MRLRQIAFIILNVIISLAVVLVVISITNSQRPSEEGQIVITVPVLVTNSDPIVITVDRRHS